MIQEPSKTQQAINQLNGSLEEAASLDKQAMDLALETLAKSILSSQEYLSLQSLQSRISKLDHPPFFSSLIQKKLQAPISTSDATQKVFQLFPPQQQTTALLIPLQQQTTALLIAIEELLKKPGTHVQSIQDILKLFPPNERTSNLFQSLCLLDLSSDMVRIAISLIKENQRDEPLLKDLKVLFENIQDFELRDIVNALGHIEEDLRAKCIQDTAFFFSKTSYKKNQDKILTSISQIRKGPNKDVIEKVLSLLEGYMQVQEKAKLIRTFGVHNIQAIFQIIDKTPQSQREEIVKHTLALLECAPRYSFLQTILQEILNLPQDQRQEIIDQTIYFLEKSGNCDALDYLLPTIANIPSNQRKDIIDQAIPILQGTKEGRMHILQIISNTPPHVRQELITRATPFLKQTDNGFYQESILESFLEISKEQENTLIEQAKPLWITPYHVTTQVQCLSILQKAPDKERTEIITLTLSILSKNSDLPSYLKTIINIPHDQRQQLIQQALPLLQKIDNGNNRLKVLQAIIKVPHDQRQDVLTGGSSILDLSKYVVSELCAFLETLAKIPSDQRTELLPNAEQALQMVESPHSPSIPFKIMAYLPLKQRTLDDCKEVVLTLNKATNNYFTSSIPSLFERLSDKKNIHTLNKLLNLSPEEITLLEKHIPNLHTIEPYLDKDPSTFRKQLLSQAILHHPVELLKQREALHLLQSNDSIYAPFLQDSTSSQDRQTLQKALGFADSFFTKIDQESPYEQHLLLQWMRYLAIVKEALPEGVDLSSHLPTLQALFDLRPPPLRYKVSSLFFSAIQDKETSKRFSSLKKQLTNPLYAVLLSHFGEFPPDLESRVIKALNQKDFKKAFEYTRPALEALCTLVQVPSLSLEEKRTCLAILFPEKPLSRKDLRDSLRLLETLCHLGHEQKLLHISTPNQLEEALQELFQTIIGISETADFAQKYQTTFDSFRQPTAIFTYAGKLQGEPQARMALTTFTKEVLEGTFLTNRYKESKHLSTAFEQSKEKETLWIQGQTSPLESLLDQTPSTIEKCSLQNFLKEKILTDRHIDPKEVPLLSQFLQDPSSVSLPSSVETDLQKLEVGLIKLLQKPDLPLEEQIFLYEKDVAPFIKQALASCPLFRQNVEEIKQLLTPSMKITSYQGWTAVDTDSAEDLLLCGTEVVGSCQSIHTSGNMNRCLLGYLLDGKNRLTAIKNKKGEIVARCIFKVLWDATIRSPVLLQERLYTQPNVDPIIEKALDLFCLQRAQALGLPLVKTSEDHHLPLYPYSIASLGNRAPFEYSDAGDGLTNGHFRLSNVRVVFDPKQS